MALRSHDGLLDDEPIRRLLCRGPTRQLVGRHRRVQRLRRGRSIQQLLRHRPLCSVGARWHVGDQRSPNGIVGADVKPEVTYTPRGGDPSVVASTLSEEVRLVRRCRGC